MTTDAISQRITVARYGMTRKEMYARAGISDAQRNWKYHDQSPTLTTLDKLAGVLDVDPAWLAYGDEPEPRPPMPYESRPVNRLSGRMEAVHDAWEGNGLGLELFTALRRTGLDGGIYLLGKEDGELMYDHVGFHNVRLGLEWWKNAPGTFVGETDPDKDFAYGCLLEYRDSLENNMPRRDACRGLGYGWDRLLLPCGDRLLGVNEIREMT